MKLNSLEDLQEMIALSGRYATELGLKPSIVKKGALTEREKSIMAQLLTLQSRSQIEQDARDDRAVQEFQLTAGERPKQLGSGQSKTLSCEKLILEYLKIHKEGSLADITEYAHLHNPGLGK